VKISIDTKNILNSDKNIFKCKKGRKDEQSPCRKLRKTECSGWQNTIPRIFCQILAENPAEQRGSVGLFCQKMLENPRLCYKYKTYGKCGSKLKFAITPREYKLKLNMWIRTEEKVLFVMRQVECLTKLIALFNWRKSPKSARNSWVTKKENLVKNRKDFVWKLHLKNLKEYQQRMHGKNTISQPRDSFIKILHSL